MGRRGRGDDRAEGKAGLRIKEIVVDDSKRNFGGEVAI